MSDLIELLLARIAEDEAEAEKRRDHNGGGVFASDNYGCLLIQPARVLAECEAKRAIIEAHQNQEANDDDMAWIVASEVLLNALASIYADHRGCREEWIMA